ncbi:MAG: molybdate ABC transporter permease subunit [Candidatus Riflebacteria bacterium]|nr:molybdate ABC transporter permease subunit [Candidatus Riflebacteria bacterium]
MLDAADLTTIALTTRLAATTTAILLVGGTPLAWWLARTRWRGRVLVEAVVALPLVLPPTVLGYYLLVLLGPNGAIGGALERAGGHHLAFTFTGMVIASVLYSLPFAIQPLQDAFAAVGQRPLEVAATLRAGPLRRFFTVAVPLARRGFVSAAAMSFAHTLGEFGVILMVGGNIPGVTRVLSIAIYDHAEALDHARAQVLAGGLLAFSFLLLTGLYLVNRAFERTRL